MYSVTAKETYKKRTVQPVESDSPTNDDDDDDDESMRLFFYRQLWLVFSK